VSVPGATNAPGTTETRERNYGQVAATIFTDATSSVRALPIFELLLPAVAAGRPAPDGSADVAPAAPAVLAAPPVLVAPDDEAIARLPVTAMRCPT
jgi:hypothetical protein